MIPVSLILIFLDVYNESFLNNFARLNFSLSNFSANTLICVIYILFIFLCIIVLMDIHNFKGEI